MPRSQFSIREVLIRLVPFAAAVAMIARAAVTWGPANLIVLASFVLIAAAFLSCLPIIPHRPFWAGLSGFGLFYALLCASAIPGLDRSDLPTEERFRQLAESNVPLGPARSFDAWEGEPERRQSADTFVNACHAVTALAIGLLGGGASLLLASAGGRKRFHPTLAPESDLPLQNIVLPPFTIDRHLNSN